MKVLRKYLLCFILLTYAGGLYLRWYQLTYFYRIQDTYFSGIATTLGSITVLLIAIGIVDFKILTKFYKIINKIKSGGSITENERNSALSASKKINAVCIATNAIGFVVGQVVASMLDVANGVVNGTPSRLAFIFLEAILVGGSLSLYEIIILGRLIEDDRKLLQINSVEKLDKKFSMSIRGKFILAAIVGLSLMGLQCFCACYQIIFQDAGIPVVDTMSEYLKTFFPVFFGSLIPSLGLIVILAFEMKHRLQTTAERIQDIGNKGDLSSRISISSSDEIGQLTSCLNTLMEQFSTLINKIKTETKIVADSANKLALSADISAKALGEMKTSVQKVTAEGNRQGGLVNIASNGITHVTGSAQEVEQQVSMQATAVQQTSASVNEMVANIQSVAELTEKAEKVSADLQTTSTNGTSAISTAVSSIIEIRTASQAVQEIVTLIKKLASQTNLLSMNAAIEAAHAGTYGQGFAVVADEVRTLATSSSASAKNIQTHIKTMNQKIDAGVKAIEAAGTAFNEINNGIENTSDLVQTIARAMEEQRIGANETLKSTESVVDAIHEIQELSRQQREYAENAAASISQVVAAFGDISSALSENAVNSDNLEKAIEDVDGFIKGNTSAVERMNAEINVFQL